MEEILAKIENEINNIKEKQQETQTLTEKSETIRKEEEQLKQEQSLMEDKESGFYYDLSKKIEEKHAEFITANNERMNKNRDIEQLISEKKSEIKMLLQQKKAYIDENRNVDLTGVDFAQLKSEKEKIEKEIALNDTTKEEFLKLSDSEKQEVRKAKERYLINKHRLAEISPTVELLETLDGKTPRDRYLEIDNYEKMIDENFNKNNLDKILESINGEKEEEKNAKNKQENRENQENQENQEKDDKSIEQIMQEWDDIKKNNSEAKTEMPSFLKNYTNGKNSTLPRRDNKEKVPEVLKVIINARTGKYEIIDENTNISKVSLDINKKFLNKRKRESKEYEICERYDKFIDSNYIEKLSLLDINLLNLYEKYDAENGTNFAETYISEFGESNPNMPTKVEYDLKARNDANEKEKGNIIMGPLAKFRLKGIAKFHEKMNLAEVKEDAKANIFDKILTGISNIRNRGNKEISAKKESPKLNAPEKKSGLRDTIEKVNVSEEKAVENANAKAEAKAQEQKTENVQDIMSQDEH